MPSGTPSPYGDTAAGEQRHGVGFDEHTSPVPGWGFSALYREHHRRCLALARQVVRDEHLAHDVVQEAFLALWRTGRSHYRPQRGTLLAWLLTVTHHQAVDAVRVAERERRRVAGAQELAPRLSECAGADEMAWLRLRRAELQAALASLPGPQREAVVLSFLGGLSHREIAEVTGAPIGTVKTRVRTGLRRLRGELESDEGSALR